MQFRLFPFRFEVLVSSKVSSFRFTVLNQPALLFYSGSGTSSSRFRSAIRVLILLHFRFSGADVFLGFIDSFLGICR